MKNNLVSSVRTDSCKNSNFRTRDGYNNSPHKPLIESIMWLLQFYTLKAQGFQERNVWTWVGDCHKNILLNLHDRSAASETNVFPFPLEFSGTCQNFGLFFTCLSHLFGLTLVPGDIRSEVFYQVSRTNMETHKSIVRIPVSEKTLLHISVMGEGTSSCKGWHRKLHGN